MWTIVLCAVAVLVVYYTHWFYKWRNPTCNGVLPPGSMGFPIIGETLEFITPSYSLDFHPFIKKRIQRWGPIFRTNLVGRPVVVSADPEINSYIIQNEGKLVDLWYMDAFSTLLPESGESKTKVDAIIHKYIRSLFLTSFGSESLKERLLPRVENIISKSLEMWARGALVNVKPAIAVMICDFTAKQLYNFDPENESDKISKKITKVGDALMCWPLNIPGTTYHKCLKEKDSALKILRSILKERMNSPGEFRRGDFLDQVIAEIDKEKFLTEDFFVTVMFGILFASSETISSALTLALKLIGDHPPVLEELTVEHETFLKLRENPDSPLTWAEYNSMTFTHQVINETLRLLNFIPGLLRRSLQDIQVKGYTIPAGWVIMVVNYAHHLNPTIFKDPLEFNPWRWKEFDSYAVSKNFMPFGGGKRQCAGSEFSKLLLAIFLHKLVTKYKWNIIKQGKIGKNPNLVFGDGVHISFSPKDK